MVIQVQLKQAGKRKNQITKIPIELEAVPEKVEDLLRYSVRFCLREFQSKQNSETVGRMYCYAHCGNMKFVPFRCKSRFCPTCGVKYCQERSTQMAFKLIRCTHRHCVFTIDEELRHFFLEGRSPQSPPIPHWALFQNNQGTSLPQR